MKTYYKRIFAFIFFVSFRYTASPQVSNWLWAHSAGGIKYDMGNSITTDPFGNIIATGYFASSSITFGSTTLINFDTSRNDIFIVKYDPIGTVLWAKSEGGNSHDNGNSITTDATGNIIVTGTFFSDSITFGTTTFI